MVFIQLAFEFARNTLPVRGALVALRRSLYDELPSCMCVRAVRFLRIDQISAFDESSNLNPKRCKPPALTEAL